MQFLDTNFQGQTEGLKITWHTHSTQEKHSLEK